MASERVEAIDFGVAWEPNDPGPILIQTEFTAVLVVNPHFDDHTISVHWSSRGAVVAGRCSGTRTMRRGTGIRSGTGG